MVGDLPARLFREPRGRRLARDSRSLFSGEALGRARSNLERIPRAEWRLVKADVEDLELPRRYDLVLSAKLFKHLWHADAILPRLMRLVAAAGSFLFELATDGDSSLEKCRTRGRRIGGRCFALDDGTPYRFFSAAEVRRLFAPLAEIEVRRVSYWDEPHRVLSSRRRHRHESWPVIGQPHRRRSPTSSGARRSTR